MNNPALKNPQQDQKTKITSRWDLPFVTRDESGRVSFWNVEHSPQDNFTECVNRGVSYADALLEYADSDPADAWVVMRATQKGFAPRGWGEEMGFMERIAQYAIAARLAFGSNIPESRDAKYIYAAEWEQLLSFGA